MQARGIRPGRALQQWQAGACPPANAKLLGIRRGSPVLQIQRTTFDLESHPFEYLESCFRGDRYVFQAELQNQYLGVRPTGPQAPSTA